MKLPTDRKYYDTRITQIRQPCSPCSVMCNITEPSFSPKRMRSSLHMDLHSQNLLNIYYFQSDYHCTFDISQMEETNVRELIKIAVEQFCLEKYNFKPEHINTETYELKLADFNNKHDPLIDAIAYDDTIQVYGGSNLCLLRKTARQSNRQFYQKKLKCLEIFQIDVSLERLQDQAINQILSVPKGSTIGQLKDKIIQSSNLTQSVEYVLAAYNTMTVYPVTETVDEIAQRHFQLFKNKHKVFIDEPGTYLAVNIEENRPKTMNEFTLTKEEIQQCFNFQEDVSILVDNGIHLLSGKCYLTLEKANIVERTQQSAFSKLINFVWQDQPRQQFHLQSLLSITADNNILRMVYLFRDETFTKKYQVSNRESCKHFVGEILKRCRMLRKRLVQWYQIE